MIKVLIASMTDYQYLSLAAVGGDAWGARITHRLYVDSISLFMRISREKLSYGPYAKSHERSFIMRIHLWFAHAHSHHRFAEQNITIHQTFFCQISR